MHTCLSYVCMYVLMYMYALNVCYGSLYVRRVYVHTEAHTESRDPSVLTFSHLCSHDTLFAVPRHQSNYVLFSLSLRFVPLF